MPVRANTLIPYFEAANRLTGHCTAAVRGKRFVRVSANPAGGMEGTENMRIAECNAVGQRAVGVAVMDGGIDEEIPQINNNLLVPMTSGAAVSAGDAIMTDAQGRAIPYALPVTPAEGAAMPVRHCHGVAVTTVAGADLTVAVKLQNL